MNVYIYEGERVYLCVLYKYAHRCTNLHQIWSNSRGLPWGGFKCFSI
jgi:hypothetical protein